MRHSIYREVAMLVLMNINAVVDGASAMALRESSHARVCPLLATADSGRFWSASPDQRYGATKQEQTPQT